MRANLRATLGRHADLALVSLVVGILVVLFVPIPAMLLDLLVLSNFSFALLILLLTFYMARPVEFSTFPSLLLVATLFRLSLNIAATRLILTDADAGKVINAVGSLVVGGNYVIGLIVFLILVVVQYVVVTSGAQRVSEVAARFTLDSMPGQQMSIDADLNMGFIDQAEAMRRRKLIEKEAGFYGAMDGASKFVKGDAIAGIVMVVAAVVTAGAALGAMGLLAPGASLLGMGAGWASSLGLAGLGGAPGLIAAAGMGAAIYAGASVLTQGLAVASGLQEKFSWKAVAKSAVSGAFAGASAALPGYFGVAVNPTTGVATSFNAKLVGAQVGTEVVRQSIVDGKVSSVAGVLGAALQAGALAKAGAAGAFVAKNFGAVQGGLRVTEGLARGSDTALDWVSMTSASLGIGGNLYSAGQFNWQDVAITAAGAAIVGARRGQDAALNYIGQAIAVPIGNVLGSSLADAMGPQPESIYSLASGESGMGLRTGAGSGLGLRYASARATGTGAADPVFASDSARGVYDHLVDAIGNYQRVDDEDPVLLAANGGGIRGGVAPLGSSAGNYRNQMDIASDNSATARMRAAGIDSSSSLLGATAGVASSFASMAAGTARLGSNMLMQIGNVLTGGINNDHPMMHQVRAEQRALGQGIVNLVTSPVATATNLVEGVVHRYDSAMAQSNNFDRSYELGRLFNDVGQSAIGGGLAIRGAARLGASGLEYIGENAFMGPVAGGRSLQIGGINLRAYDADTRARILEGFRSGNQFETQARAAMDVSKNYDRIYGSGELAGKYAVPDSMPAGIVEFKDVRELSRDLQFRLYEQSQKRIDLVVSPRTEYISRPLMDSVRNSSGSISIFNPRSGLFHPYDFDSGVFLITRPK